MVKNKQLDFWNGTFGDSYNQRNYFDEERLRQTKVVFERVLKGLDVTSILEIGTNIGINLMAIRHILGEKVDLYALEPNKIAYDDISKNNEISLKKGFNCSVFDMPLEKNSIDLVFTKTVLIHIAPENLKEAMQKMVDVSKKYTLYGIFFS